VLTNKLSNANKNKTTLAEIINKQIAKTMTMYNPNKGTYNRKK